MDSTTLAKHKRAAQDQLVTLTKQLASLSGIRSTDVHAALNEQVRPVMQDLRQLEAIVAILEKCLPRLRSKIKKEMVEPEEPTP